MNRKVCIVIPTYNNAATLLRVIGEVLRYGLPLIVVDDGSTDDTPQLLASCADRITLLTHPHNRGKGAALLTGLREAGRCGFDNAITLDSDGQHSASDIPQILAAIARHPFSIIVGNRFDRSRFDSSNMRGQSRFANRFSNFWFCVYTGRKLADTQSGYRAYPLRQLRWLGCVTSGYEAELELLVYAAWHGVRIEELPVSVYYAPAGERVSHFRPGRDFARISLLNTLLFPVALLYAWPRKLVLWVLGATVLLLLFVVMAVVQVGLLLYFSSHRVSEREKLGYHGCICAITRWMAFHIPWVKTRIVNPHGEDFTRPAIIISNHQSHLDLLCIMALTPRLVIVTKRWVWRNPLYGLAIRYAEFLPVNTDFERNREKLHSLVRRGYSVVIFPEGTRSASLEVGRFHQGAFYLAWDFGLDILPIVLHGTGNVLNKKAKRISPGEIDIEVKERVSLTSGELGESPMDVAKAFRERYRRGVRSWETGARD